MAISRSLSAATKLPALCDKNQVLCSVIYIKTGIPQKNGYGNRVNFFICNSSFNQKKIFHGKTRSNHFRKVFLSD